MSRWTSQGCLKEYGVANMVSSVLLKLTQYSLTTVVFAENFDPNYSAFQNTYLWKPAHLILQWFYIKKSFSEQKFLFFSDILLKKGQYLKTSFIINVGRTRVFGLQTLILGHTDKIWCWLRVNCVYAPMLFDFKFVSKAIKCYL